MSKNTKDIPTLPLLSAAQLAKVEMEWANSAAKKRIDEYNRRLQLKIKVMNVGSYSDIDRVRTFVGAEK